MKNILILLFLTFSLLTNAQREQTHIPALKSIVGIWRQTGIALTNGNTMDRLNGNYKVINADGSYYTFVTWPNETVIGQYGTYKIKSDSILVEHIIMHEMNSNLNGKDCTIKYKLIDETTLMMAWSFDNEKWVNEKWTRLPLAR
ncbi:DUF4488 domain-containing protein [Mariniflexile sp. HMF6888]|uniref:DUF4488 domain-containing protein n=1 Tax=Mariniflexile sp. HMF6888 TaxID=3373086 RepID=UPI003787380A